MNRHSPSLILVRCIRNIRLKRLYRLCWVHVLLIISLRTIISLRIYFFSFFLLFVFATWYHIAYIDCIRSTRSSLFLCAWLFLCDIAFPPPFFFVHDYVFATVVLFLFFLFVVFTTSYYIAYIDCVGFAWFFFLHDYFFATVFFSFFPCWMCSHHQPITPISTELVANYFFAHDFFFANFFYLFRINVWTYGQMLYIWIACKWSLSHTYTHTRTQKYAHICTHILSDTRTRAHAHT